MLQVKKSENHERNTTLFLWNFPNIVFGDKLSKQDHKYYGINGLPTSIVQTKIKTQVLSQILGCERKWNTQMELLIWGAKMFGRNIR